MSSSQEVFEFGRASTPEQWFVAGAASLLLAGVVVALYRRDVRGLRPAVAVALLGLRLTALAVVGWAALDPRTVVETTVTYPPRVVVLLDRSRSMGTLDVESPTGPSSRTSRWQSLRAVIGERVRNAWAQDRDVQYFTFGRELRPVADMAALGAAADEGETRLGSAVVNVVSGKERRPPAAVVVASDGGLNAGAPLDEAVAAAKAARVPVHAIAFGAEQPLPNLRVVDVRLPPRVFRGSDDAAGAATIEVTGAVAGTVDVVFEAKRLDGAATIVPIGKASIRASSSEPATTAPFAFPPREAGRWEVSARIDVRPGELRTDDNRAATAIDVVERKTRVLLIAGSATREYQFLRSVLFRDKSVELSVWLQPGRTGVSQDAQKVTDKFPESRADLFGYDVLVAIDPDWRSLDERALQNLADWVSTQGAGILFVAGPAFWTKLDPDSTIVGLSPVVPRRQVLEPTNAPAAEVRPLAFTRDGEAARSLALADDAAQSRSFWAEFPGVYWSASVERLKPGAILLATACEPSASTGTSGAPFLASQYFGSGRAIYIGSGELWRLRRNDERLYERLWTQLVRHAGEGRLLRGSRRGNFLVDEREIPFGQDLPVRLFVLDEKFMPLRAAKLTASATTRRGPAELILEPVPGQVGRFQGLLPSPAPGSVTIQVPLPGGGALEETFSVRESRVETDDVRVRRDLLGQLATGTGGKLFSPASIDAVADALPSNSESTVLTSPPRTLWDRPWLVLVLVGLLSAEWATRKWNRLA